MKDKSSKIVSAWLKETIVGSEVSQWATNGLKSEYSSESNKLEKAPNRIPEIKQKIRDREKHIDDLSLISPTSYKLQVTVPSNINYLMKAWANAEGRDLSSVALQCLEIGLRELKGSGNIPTIAIKLYEIACEKRIAISELNSKCDSLEKELKAKGDSYE